MYTGTYSFVGCIWNLTENEKIDAVMYLLMRDFQDLESEITLDQHERICHEIIQKRSGNHGKFTDRCCHISPITKELECTTDIINIWLKLLLMVLVSVKFGLLFFGPVSFIPFIESIAREDIPYVVQLNDPLVKTIYLCNSDTHIDKTYDKVLDLRGKRGFPKLRESFRHVPIGEPVKIKFKRYDILVNYKNLLVENDVPVGLCSSITDALCKCKIREIGPFVQCCASNMFKSLSRVDKEAPWINFFKIVAKILVVLLAPLPFYIRLWIFYNFEAEEIEVRTAHVRSLGMEPQYEGSILTYLTPTHPLFICIYVTYFLTAIVIGGVARGDRKEKLASIIVGSFRDLKSLSYIEALGLLVGNIIWPFKRYGILGCLMAPVYWLIVLPFTAALYVFYCLPTIYVAFRMLWRVQSTPQIRHPSGRYKVIKEFDKSMHNFETEELINRMQHSDSVSSIDSLHKSKRRCRVNSKFITNLCLSVMCVLTMFGVLIVLSEVIGFLVEIAVFTMMGVIVNAGAVLKYVTLLILVVVYSYDTYNNVGKKYLKLNKALFNEVKGRCKDIDVVTSMPSHLQENHGFKSQELSEQADYEESDGIADDRKLHWMINDLVLFVDNEDMPRIPQKLFEEVCQIRVAGAPGPVHQSLIEATQGFLKIMVFIFFVFVVVLTFGAVYQVSSTNQMLAALAGGFLPFIMKTFMAPNKPDIEIGTVSFKSKLDEIIKNFKQNWPIFDFPFELWTEEDEKEKEEKEKEETDKKDDDDTKDLNANEPIGDTFHDARDTHDGIFKNKNNNSASKLTDLPLELQPLTPKPNGKLNEPVDVTIPMEEPVEEEPKFDVDIVVFLPDAPKHNTDKWLDEWSDLDSYDERNEDTMSIQSYLRKKRRKASKASNHSRIYKKPGEII